jgi:hypothetical protein
MQLTGITPTADDGHVVALDHHHLEFTVVLGGDGEQVRCIDYSGGVRRIGSVGTQTRDLVLRAAHAAVLAKQTLRRIAGASRSFN